MIYQGWLPSTTLYLHLYWLIFVLVIELRLFVSMPDGIWHEYIISIDIFFSFVLGWPVIK